LGADKPPNLETHEVGLSGLLLVLNQDTKPNPTLFSFPSRHRLAESSFSAEFLNPTGLHPLLLIRLASSKPPPGGSYCYPHAYLTLPRAIFADKYQFADDLYLASKNLTALRYISQPVDLEAPEYAVKSWGSAALVELAAPAYEENQPWSAEVPLHLRYLSPAEGGYTNVEIPYPVVFWACTAEEGTKFPSNPFDRVNLGYDGLFGPRTVFWHVTPSPETGDRLMINLKVPVLDIEKAGWLNLGTAAVIMLGFAWVVWKLYTVFTVYGYGTNASRPSGLGDEKKKQ
jgi:hypothetical protein